LLLQKNYISNKKSNRKKKLQTLLQKIYLIQWIYKYINVNWIELIKNYLKKLKKSVELIINIIYKKIN
jgi:hypothetical protein